MSRPPDRADRPRRLLIAGLGSIGKRHLANLVALGAGEVVAFDPHADRREAVEKRFGVPTVASLAEAWERKPDAAIIAAPTSLHLPLALEAAGRGCHLFVEKPLADRWEGVERLLEAVREKGLKTLVGCNLRFHPGLQAVKGLLASGAVGRPLAGRFEMGHYLPDWRPWDDYRQSYSARAALGGGIILDAIHELDYARWLLGEVSAVFCMAAKLSELEIDVEDDAAIVLRFASGAIGEVHLDYLQRAYSRTCQIIAERGTLCWDFAAGRVRWYSAEERRWREIANPPTWRLERMYADEMAHFLRCLDGAETPALDVFAAARVLRIALAAKASARERRLVAL